MGTGVGVHAGVQAGVSTGAETRRPHLSVTDPVSHGLLRSDGDTGMSVRRGSEWWPEKRLKSIDYTRQAITIGAVSKAALRSAGSGATCL